MANNMIRFTKMHGLGNDYVYVNTLLYNVSNPEEFSRRISQRHTGIGSDGLVLIGYAGTPEADYSMRIFNQDGSEAMMCGNASRCIGKYLFEKRLTDKTQIRLETLSGIKTLSLKVLQGKVQSVTVDMQEPCFHNPEQCLFQGGRMIDEGLSAIDNTSEAAEGGIRGTFVSMGNPHFVIFCDEVPSDEDLANLGRQIEMHPMFPQRVNVEFACLKADGSIRMRVWERGSGITMACGTGACATAAAAILTQRACSPVAVEMDGGTLQLSWQGEGTPLFMEGGAEMVFEGEIEA